MNTVEWEQVMMIGFLIIPFGLMCWFGIIALGINLWIWAKSELGR